MSKRSVISDVQILPDPLFLFPLNALRPHLSRKREYLKNPISNRKYTVGVNEQKNTYSQITNAQNSVNYYTLKI